jgi:hypothetical protein
MPDIVECLARLAVGDAHHLTAARLFGAADAIRKGIGVVRFKAYQDGYDGEVKKSPRSAGRSPELISWNCPYVSRTESTRLSLDSKALTEEVVSRGLMLDDTDEPKTTRVMKRLAGLD